MFDIDIDLSIIEKLLGEAQKELQDDVAAAVGAACKEGAEEAKKTHVFKNRRPDGLESTIYGYGTSSGPKNFDGVIGAASELASLVEEGTPPHVIRAKVKGGFIGPLQSGNGARALTFAINGQTVHYANVNHPGTKPDGFMGRAYQKAERVLIRELEIAVAKAAEKLNR